MSTILIVDDDASARETLVSMLEGENYSLALAKNGVQAIEMAEQLKPDLILLDVMMPGLDGFEVCHRIRYTSSLVEVPIVLLTALDDRESLLKGIQSGADDFLSKPVDRQELKARVRTITRLSRYRTLLEQRENLRQMAERAILTQEEERLRLSREVHDHLDHAITTHLDIIRNLQENPSIPKVELFKRLDLLFAGASEMLAKTRQLAQNLRSPALESLGLKVAMQNYCTEFSRITQLPVVFESDEDLPTLSDSYNGTLYRVLQEGLMNIVKHAQASQIWVDLTLEHAVISLTIRDNGQGFAADSPSSTGKGLTGLRERLTLAGGKFKVSSKPKRGTILLAQLPFADVPPSPEET